MEESEYHILIGTPMYGGMCHRGYIESLLRLQQICMGLGIKVTHKFISNESLITRGRNLINAIFMSNASYTHLLFIDSDISFNHNSIIRMIQSNLDIVCGAYPKKAINWDKVFQLMEYKDVNKENIEIMISDYVVNFKHDHKGQVLIKNGFCEVLYGGTGMMLIKKSVMLCLKDKYSHLKYRNDVGGINPTPEMEDNFYSIFDCAICPKTQRYLSEDYLFCQRAVDNGYSIWIDLNCPLTHTGTYSFQGDFGQFLMVNQSINQIEREKAEKADK